jgi:hypothetical protein
MAVHITSYIAGPMMLALDSLRVLSDGAVIGADIGDGKDRIIRTQSARHRVDHGTICRGSVR